jgi:hypothetical protein
MLLFHCTKNKSTDGVALVGDLLEMLMHRVTTSDASVSVPELKSWPGVCCTEYVRKDTKDVNLNTVANDIQSFVFGDGQHVVVCAGECALLADGNFKGTTKQHEQKTYFFRTVAILLETKAFGVRQELTISGKCFQFGQELTVQCGDLGAYAAKKGCIVQFTLADGASHSVVQSFVEKFWKDFEFSQIMSPSEQTAVSDNAQIQRAHQYLMLTRKIGVFR